MDNTADQYQELALRLLPQLAAYVQESQSGATRVLEQMPATELASTLQLEKWITEGGLQGESASHFLTSYLANSQRMHHPRYIGHQVSSHHLSAGIADMIQGVVNNPMAIYEMGPSGAVIEQTIINWMLQKVGWLQQESITDFTPRADNGAGILTHGGSMANMTAMLAARARIAPQSWVEGTPADLVVMGPSVAHYSIARAVSVIGLGANSFVPIEVDDREVMLADDLPRAYQESLDRGQRVMAVVANACATTTGLYDPIAEIGAFCQEHGLWYHVDGAHGAAALLHESTRPYLAGVEMADSLIWDTHKMLRTTTLCAAVLLKDQQSLANTFRQKGSYLFHDKEEPGFDLMPYAMECTKAAIGTKPFWVLATEGEGAVAEYVYQQYSTTKAMYELINAQPDFECPYSPEANILCFRYTSGTDGNDYQLALRNEIVKRGQFYITSSEIKGRRHLRMTVINALTSLADVESLLEHIRVIAAEWKGHSK